MLYVLIAIIALVAIYFLFLRKGAEPGAAPPRSEAPSNRGAAAPAMESKKPSAAEQSAAPAAEAKEQPSAPRTSAAPPPPSRAGRTSIPPPKPSTARPLFSRRADVDTLRRGLSRSRDAGGFFGKLKGLFGGKWEIDENIAASIEEVLLASDVGVKTTNTILERVRETLGKGEHVDQQKVWGALREEARRILEVGGKARALELRAKPTVVLFVGVNGAGKTTTIGKLATQLKDEGQKCVLAAGDTFRAAAVQQLKVWGKRVGCEVDSRQGRRRSRQRRVRSDPERAREREPTWCFADTAGRLHTKTNSHDRRCKKIARTASKALEGAPHETLLVIDATNGQNAMAQAAEFKAALDLTGIVLTKLDGTAKGGVVLGICDELALPVRFVGLGERAGRSARVLC